MNIGTKKVNKMSGKRKIRKEGKYLYMYIDGEIAYKEEDETRFEEGDKAKAHKYDGYRYHSGDVGVGKEQLRYNYQGKYEEDWDTVQALSELQKLEEKEEDDEQE